MSILVIGTSHIAKQSIHQIREAMEEFKPDLVAVELDANRLQALLQRKPSRISLLHIPRIGVKGYIFAKIGQTVQQRLGKAVGVMPGADMLAAIKLAKKHELQVALIDQDVARTLRRIHFTWKERFRIIADIFGGVFRPKKELEKYGLENFDLTKVPEDKIIKKLMLTMKKRYPSLYKVLVHERNQIMIRRVKALQKAKPDKRILVVVGAGHKEDLEKAFKSI